MIDLPEHQLELKRILASSDEPLERRAAAAEALMELREEGTRERRKLA